MGLKVETTDHRSTIVAASLRKKFHRHAQEVMLISQLFLILSLHHRSVMRRYGKYCIQHLPLQNTLLDLLYS